MSSQTHNEKNFTLGDAQLFTVFAATVVGAIKASQLHTHAKYELFMFAAGNGYVEFKNKRIPFKKGSAILVAPNTEHSVKCDPGTVTTAMSIAFSFKKAEKSKHRESARIYHLFDALIPKERGSIALKDKYFADFVSTFVSQSEPVADLASMLISNMLEGLFLHIIRMLAKKKNSEREDVPIFSYTTTAVTTDVVLSRRIEDYINYTSSCTLTGLAEHINMCPRNAQKVLRKIFGKSFSVLLAERRLGHAVQLMSSTNLSLLEIAKQSGYNQYPSFRKAFISKFGKSPSKYRSALLSAPED